MFGVPAVNAQAALSPSFGSDTSFQNAFGPPPGQRLQQPLTAASNATTTGATHNNNFSGTFCLAFYVVLLPCYLYSFWFNTIRHNLPVFLLSICKKNHSSGGCFSKHVKPSLGISILFLLLLQYFAPSFVSCISNFVHLPFPAVGADFFGDILQPQSAGGGGAGGGGATNGHSAAGGGGGAGADPAKIVTGDLDASLANLTSNLNLTSGQSK